MSGEIRSHEDLVVWKKSIDFVTKIYKITSEFPKAEIYGLSAQIRRAAISIPSNIAEGSGRRSLKEYIQFLYVSLGSVTELETQLMISRNLSLLKDDEIMNELKEIKRMLIGLIHSLTKAKEIYTMIIKVSTKPEQWSLRKLNDEE
jgi:four helix bundle protein